jgi:hypothetical protein
MSTYGDMLDGLVDDVGKALNLPATRDPSVLAGLVSQGRGCVFVGFPTHIGRLLTGPNLDVPISLVAPAPSDLRSVNFLLDNMDALIEFAAVSTSTHGPLDFGVLLYPAVTVTARIAI